jgi:hypothetical protein
VTPTGIEPTTFRFVAQCLNHYATACPYRNEYQEYFLGVKAAGAYLQVSIVLKYGSHNLLEPSGPVMGLLYLFFTFLPPPIYCLKKLKLAENPVTT